MKPANIYPSLALAGEHLLLGNDAGDMLVLKPGREYRQVSESYLDEGSGACPVPAPRTGKVLWAASMGTWGKYCPSS